VPEAALRTRTICRAKLRCSAIADCDEKSSAAPEKAKQFGNQFSGIFLGGPTRPLPAAARRRLRSAACRRPEPATRSESWQQDKNPALAANRAAYPPAKLSSASACRLPLAGETMAVPARSPAPWREAAARRTTACRHPLALPHQDQAAYCAMPLPNDQFSFFTSTSVIRTSCGRTFSSAESPSAIAL